MSERSRINRQNQRVRRQLLTVYDLCNYCGKQLTFGTSTVDHVQPRYWGGTDEAGNLVLACKLCNRIKDCEAVEDLACPVRRGARLRFVWEISFQERETMTMIQFDYGQLLESQRTLAKQSAGKIRELVKLTATSIVEIGRMLTEVHGVLRDEHYQAWLRAEFGWSHNAASHYETAALRFAGVDDKTLGQFQPGAIRVLSNGKIKPAVIKEAVKRAAKGQPVSKAEAVKIIRRHTSPGESPSALRAPIYQFRSAVKRLLDLPLKERLELADELIALAMQLRGETPQAPALDGPAETPVAKGIPGPAAPLPAVPRRRRIRELAVA